MKFWAIFRFELAYQLRRAWPWLMIIILLVLGFLFMRDGSFEQALYSEFFINSPFMVAMATVFGSLLWLLMGAFVGGEAAARDISVNMHPLIYTTPLTRAQYLGGRFLAAFVLNATILLSVQVTILLAVYLPGVHPDSLGPIRPAAFLTAYGFIALPNAFAATAIQFTIALRSGRPISAYVGSLLLFFTGFFIASMILFRSGWGVLLDPIGVRYIWDELSHLWTNAEKSHRLLRLEGALLQNRLMWIGTGMTFIAIGYLTFNFKHRVAATFRIPFLNRKKSGSHAVANEAINNYAIDSAAFRNLKSLQRSFGFRFDLQRVFSIAWRAFRALVASGPGLAMVIFIPLLAIPVVIDQMVALGLPLTPTTARVVSELTGPLSADMSRWMVIPGFIIYFAGELVWREREHRVNEITDAMPGSEWAPVIGKFLGITLMLIAFTATLTLAGVFAQIIMDYDNFQFGLYIKTMFGLQLFEYLLFAVLALFVHTMVNQKYIGHLAAITAYAFIAAIATMLGIEHNLLIYGAGPGWTYTEMRGFGPFLGPWLWFKMYWAAWAFLLMIITALFWVRGQENSFRIRLQLARHRFNSSVPWATGIAVVLIFSIGGFIFYNTNILNNYKNSTEVAEWRATYERLYGHYENTPQPELTGTKLHVEIYPDQRIVEVEGSYELFNTTDTSIDTIHISMPTNGAILEQIALDQKATLALDDVSHRYRIYALKDPLKPGDTLQLTFKFNVASTGFRINGIDPSLVAGGSYFNNKNWFPSIGYQPERALINPAQRREHGLPERAVIASLSQAHNGEAIPLDRGISFDAVIGTTKGQMAVTPGALQKTWTAPGPHNEERQYFHYKSSAPLGSEWAFFSAPFQAYEKTWTPTTGNHQSVTVRIYHHPSHTDHLEHMMESVLSSLDYYTKTFGPYAYNHLTVVEHPAAPGIGMHADGSLIYYGQGYIHWLPESEHSLDLPYAIMGHEMGHQWTLPYAYVEGLPFLSEGLAWYYGIMLVKHTRSPAQTRRLMSFMRQPYPHQPIRRGEPLLRALDPYLAYKRGPLAMYALTQYVGVDSINSAIRTLNEKSNLPGAFPVSTLDLYRELKAVTPDSLQHMLYELFEVNTLWLFETSNAQAAQVGKDQWEVTLDIKAKKIVYDSAGVETDVPIANDWIPIGVFAEGKNSDELSTPLYLERHRLRAGNQQIKIIVSGKPILAGVDPHHILDWEEKEDDDNIVQVTFLNDDNTASQ